MLNCKSTKILGAGRCFSKHWLFAVVLPAVLRSQEHLMYPLQKDFLFIHDKFLIERDKVQSSSTVLLFHPTAVIHTVFLITDKTQCQKHKLDHSVTAQTLLTQTRYLMITGKFQLSKLHDLFSKYIIHSNLILVEPSLVMTLNWIHWNSINLNMCFFTGKSRIEKKCESSGFGFPSSITARSLCWPLPKLWLEWILAQGCRVSQSLDVRASQSGSSPADSIPLDSRLCWLWHSPGGKVGSSHSRQNPRFLFVSQGCIKEEADETLSWILHPSALGPL